MEKRPENIGEPIQSGRTLLNKLIKDFAGKGKLWFLTLAS